MMTDRTTRWLAAVCAGIALVSVVASCSRPPPEPPRAASSDFTYDLPMKELMEHVVQPAAFQVWHAAGVRLTRQGEVNLAPRTDAGWVEVENGAATVTETSNLLALPGRTMAPSDEWQGYVKRLRAAGQKAKAAAEARNADQLFIAGTELEAACSSCHTRFMPGGEGGGQSAQGRSSNR